MKKVLILTITIFALFCAGGAGTYKIMNNAQEYNEKQELQEAAHVLSVEKFDSTQEVEELNEAQLQEEEQIAKIRAIKYDINLKDDATQNQIIDVMHNMTHQKVRAEKKFGTIPMSDDTINQVYIVVSNSDFELKGDLLDILNEWKIGNFSGVISDHNYFWEYQGGTSGKAYGKLSLAEEEEYINKNFR